MLIEQATEWLVWLSEHPIIAGIITFFIAFSESLAFVGLIVPGAFLMVGLGALIATGYLPFWPITIAAILGAIAGDGLSYWLGQHYHERLSQFWPFKQRPQLLERGRQFFTLHGGKSVILGRFIGPLRPVIPAVAGMMNMPLARFAFTNVLSAFAWAPLYLLPGILFGLSLEMASEFAGRFSVLLVFLFFVIWLLTWLIRQTYLWLAPYTDAILFKLVKWSEKHPVAGQVSAAIVSPNHPEVRGLSLMALFLVIMTLAFISISQMITDVTIINSLNKLVNNGLQALHTPPFDLIMNWMNHLGDSLLLLIITSLVALWLAQQRHWLALWHWLAAFIFPFVLVHILNSIFALPQPPGNFEVANYAFPSSHTTLAMSVYGFLAILLAREMTERFRIAVYLIAGVIVLNIALARLYLGLEWLIDAMGGITLGFAWITLLGIAYRRHVHRARLPKRSLYILGLTPLLVMLIYPSAYLSKLNYNFHKPSNDYVMSKSAWLESGWEVLPAFRDDLRGKFEFPINIQWCGNKAEIQHILLQNGWRNSDQPVSQWFYWLNPDADIKHTPILPHVHDGNYEQLRFIKYETEKNSILVLRLWPSHIYLQNHKQKTPLWFGNVSFLVPQESFGVRFLQTDNRFNQASDSLLQDAGSIAVAIRKRTIEPGILASWDTRVLLFDQAPVKNE